MFVADHSSYIITMLCLQIFTSAGTYRPTAEASGLWNGAHVGRYLFAFDGVAGLKSGSQSTMRRVTVQHEHWDDHQVRHLSLLVD